MNKISWVHIGFGKIGKGLVTPSLKNVDSIDFMVCDRSYEPGVASYKLNVAGNSKLIENIKVVKLEDLDKNKKYIFSTSVIVTNLQVVIDNIINLGFKDFYIVPFENSEEAFNIIEKNNLKYFRTLVDRIVFDGNDREVFVESFSNLKIDKEILNVVKLPMELISDHIHNEHKMKFYFVNGLHAALAYIVENEGGSIIGDYFKNNSFKDEIINCFAKYSVENKIATHSIAIEYLNKSLRRFKEASNDPISRIGRNPELKKSRGERLEPIWQYGSKELKETIFD